MTPTAHVDTTPSVPSVVASFAASPRPRGLVPASSIGVPTRIRTGRVVVALSAPLGVGVVYALGLLVLHSYNLAYHRELLAAAILSVIAGLIAVLPMVILMGRGAIAIVHLTMIAMLVRMVLTLAGLVLLCGPGWKLDHGVLVLCTAACYFVLMIAESAATIWASRH